MTVKPWMQYGSCKYELGSPVMPSGVSMWDVANSLAKINRFTGHSIAPISVARHCLFVEMIVSKESYDPTVRLYALLHDAPESVVQDLSSPLKAALGPDGMAAYRAVEEAAEEAIYDLAGVFWPVPKDARAIIKKADIQAVMAEKDFFLPDCPDQWTYWHDVEPTTLVPQGTFSWHNDAADWMQRYDALHRAIKRMTHA